MKLLLECRQLSRIVLYFFVVLFPVVMLYADNSFYVSTYGNDNDDGSFEHPFASIEHAQKVARQSIADSDGTVTVYIKHGTYYLNSPILFSNKDSGTQSAPVIYKAFQDAVPIFTGSKEIKNWKKVDDNALTHRLPAFVRPLVYVADLKANGIQDYGDLTNPNNRPSLICNGQLQTLARWPNSGFVHAGLTLGETEIPPRYTKKHGTEQGVFEYLDEYQDRWINEKNAWLHGYWYWDWKDEHQKVENINIADNIFTLSQPYHHYGYRDSLRYYGYNMLCEIDSVTEWYLDKDSGLLFWYPQKEIDPNSATVTLTEFNEPYMVEMDNCKFITLEGLTFRESRGSGILIKEGESCEIKDCRIERLGVDAIRVENGFNHQIAGCYIHHLGGMGIYLEGGDRKTLTPSGHSVTETVVEHFSLLNRTYQPAIHTEGCGHYIAHNRFRYSSSSAMRLEGNDYIVEYNQISHVVTESDDQGGLDMWFNPSYQGIVIRYNQWSDMSGRTGHNGAAGVRLDDMISGVQIYGNVFERCGSVIFGAVQIHGGKENVVENNLFYQCHAAVSFSPWGEKRWLEFLDKDVVQNKLYKDVDTSSSLYQEKYPVLRDLRSNHDRNIVKNNLIVDCKELFLRNKNNVNVIKDNNVFPSGGKTVEQLCGPDVMKLYGLETIPIEKMGPLHNKWVK